jgi:hypothetical protein
LLLSFWPGTFVCFHSLASASRLFFSRNTLYLIHFFETAKMHGISLLPLAAGLVAALPAGQAPESSFGARQLGGGNTRNDVEDGGTCPEVVLVYARATGERGNLVSSTIRDPPETPR